MAARLSRLRADEDGFTIIEVLVAAFILVLGSLAVFMTFAAAIHNVQRGKETQQGISVAQREVERLRVVPFKSLVMTANPGHVDEANNPRRRVVGEGEGERFEAKREGGEELPLVLPKAKGEAVKPMVEPVTPNVSSPDGSAMTVFRFVLCEPVGEATPPPECAAKRIVVDVAPSPADNQSGYRHSYYELQSTVVNPEG